MGYFAAIFCLVGSLLGRFMKHRAKFRNNMKSCEKNNGTFAKKRKKTRL